MSKTKYKKPDKNKNNNTKTRIAAGAYLSPKKKKRKNKTGYIIPAMNCYPRNGSLRDPDFLTIHFSDSSSW